MHIYFLKKTTLYLYMIDSGRRVESSRCCSPRMPRMYSSISWDLPEVLRKSLSLSPLISFFLLSSNFLRGYSVFPIFTSSLHCFHGFPIYKLFIAGYHSPLTFHLSSLCLHNQQRASPGFTSAPATTVEERLQNGALTLNLKA